MWGLRSRVCKSDTRWWTAVMSMLYLRIGSNESNLWRGIYQHSDHKSQEDPDRHENGGEEEIEQFVWQWEVKAVGEQLPSCGWGSGGHRDSQYRIIILKHNTFTWRMTFWAFLSCHSCLSLCLLCWVTGPASHNHQQVAAASITSYLQCSAVSSVLSAISPRFTRLTPQWTGEGVEGGTY